MKKKLKFIVVFICAFLLFSTVTFARSYMKSLFQFKENVKVKEELDGTAFLFGDTVDVEKTINGIGFIAGTTVNINDKQQYIFSTGDKIVIEAETQNDVFLLGSTINFKKDATIGRDAYIFGDTVNLEGNIARNVYIYGNTVKLKGNFEGNVVVTATTIDVDGQIQGKLKYNDTAIVNGDLKGIKTEKFETKDNSTTYLDYLKTRLSSFIHILIIGIVIAWILGNVLEKSLKQTKDASTKNYLILGFKGFLILIGVPIISFMLFLTGVFMSLGLIMGIIYGILVYIANIFTAYFIAKLIDKKYLNKNLNNYTLLLFGLALIYIVELIPIVGSVLGFISLLLGLGIIGNMITELKK